MEFTGFTFEHTFTNVSSETLEIFFHRVSDRYGVSFLKYGGNFPSSQILVIPKTYFCAMYFGPCETDELRSVNSCETDAICVLYKRLLF